MNTAVSPSPVRSTSSQRTSRTGRRGERDHEHGRDDDRHGDLIFGAVMDDAGATCDGAGAGFTQRLSVNNKDLVSEDLIQARPARSRRRRRSVRRPIPGADGRVQAPLARAPNRGVARLRHATFDAVAVIESACLSTTGLLPMALAAS